MINFRFFCCFVCEVTESDHIDYKIVAYYITHKTFNNRVEYVNGGNGDCGNSINFVSKRFYPTVFLVLLFLLGVSSHN